MDETSQIQPPPSFAALYADRHGRLKASIADVVGRYELCEDLASHLVEQAQTLYHSGNSSEQGVLLGMHAGLAAEGLLDILFSDRYPPSLLQAAFVRASGPS